MMDSDSSTKFIGSLTKFLQSLCNGYVEFQRGVELVGHIYLSIDTGEKVDYILHEKVSKNDENSVTFVSNSFHALPLDKLVAKKDASAKPGAGENDSDSDDDIMIVDQTSKEETPGSTNFGTIPSRNAKQMASSRTEGPLQQGSTSTSSPQRNRQQSGRPSATVTSQSQGTSQENINIGEVKLEQISSDELLSLASQVDEGDMQSRAGGTGRIGRRAFSDTAGQPVWIKQEAADDGHGGPDTGWSQGGEGHSDSSNSGSNLYPIMMHQNPAGFSSSPVFPGFSSTSGPSASHGFPHSRHGPSGTTNPYGNPTPGTSQSMSSMDPAVPVNQRSGLFWSTRRHRPDQKAGRSVADYSRLYRARIRHDPERFLHYKMKHKERNDRYRERRRQKMLQAQGVISAWKDCSTVGILNNKNEN